MILIFTEKLKCLNQNSYDSAIKYIKENWNDFVSSVFGSDAHVIFWGTYVRYFVSDKEPFRFPLRIQRIFDVNAKTTYSLLTANLVPYSTIPVVVQAEIIDAMDDELPDISARYNLCRGTLLHVRKHFRSFWDFAVDWFFNPLDFLVLESFRVMGRQFMQARVHPLLFAPT